MILSIAPRPPPEIDVMSSHGVGGGDGGPPTRGVAVDTGLQQPPITTVAALWIAAWTATPDAVAVCSVEETGGEPELHTYDELHCIALGVAGRLATLCGRGKGELVAVVADNGWRLLGALLGVVLSGNVYFPLGPPPTTSADMGPEYLATLLRTAGDRCSVVVCDTRETAACLDGMLTSKPPHQPRPHDHNYRVLCVETVSPSVSEAEANLHGSVLSLAVPAPTDLCWAFLTSGTTSGVRKLVLAQHCEVACYVKAAQHRYGLGPKTRWFLGCSVGFDPNAGDAIMTLAAGGTVCCARWTDTLAALSHNIAITRATAAGSTPTVWSSFGGVPTDACTLEIVTLGGESMDSRLAMRWAARVVLWNMYGLTEGVVYQCTHRIPPDFADLALEAQIEHVHRLGSPLESVTVTTVSMGDDVVEVLLGGAQVARHCRCDDELLHTGDFARQSPRGDLVLVGRRDNQVKRGGRRINLEEIDIAILLGCCSLVDTAISFCGMEDRGIIEAAVLLPPTIMAEVRQSTWAHLLPRALLQLARQRWPSFMLPSRLHIWSRAAFPLTATGKLDRHAVRTSVGLSDSDLANSGADAAPHRALTTIERAIAQVWSSVFHTPLETVHGETTIEELGVDSLSAMRCSRKLFEIFEGPINHGTNDGRAGVIRGVFSPRTILANPVLQDYAAVVSSCPSVLAFLKRHHSGGHHTAVPPDATSAGQPLPVTAPTSIHRRSDVSELLLQTIRAGSNQLMVALLDASADVDGMVGRTARGLAPLHVAAQVGSTFATQALLQRGARTTATTPEHLVPAHFAAAHSADVLAMLLAAGSPLRATDANKQSMVHHAARAGRADCIKTLADAGVPLTMADRWHRHPLSWAILNGHPGAVVALLSIDGCDVNFKIPHRQHAKRTALAQEPPLHIAARLSRVTILKALLEHGARVDLADDEGRFPLHSAALCVPPALESHGADQDPTVVAQSFRPSAEVVRLLLAAGASVEEQPSPDHPTLPPPLHFAAMHGNVGVVAALLQAGHSPDEVDRQGRTARACAALPTTAVAGLGRTPFLAFPVARRCIQEMMGAEPRLSRLPTASLVDDTHI